MAGIAIHCERCGKQIRRRRSVVIPYKHHYCSRACHYPRAMRNCVVCGRSFGVSPSNEKTHNYCSKECYDYSQRGGPLITLQCFVCGIPVKRRSPRRSERNSHTFCSRKCFVTYWKTCAPVLAKKNAPPKHTVWCVVCNAPLHRAKWQLRSTYPICQRNGDCYKILMSVLGRVDKYGIPRTELTGMLHNPQITRRCKWLSETRKRYKELLRQLANH